MIDFAFRGVFTEREIETSVSRAGIKSLLYLCTKYAQFTFNNKTSLQTDGVPMSSLLGPVLAGILTVESERMLVITTYAITAYETMEMLCR